MGSERDIIIVEASGLGIDDSIRIVCPWCQGGSTHEPTLSITRKADGVLYNCHRASCGQRGFAGTAAWTMCKARPAESKLKPYTGSLLPLEDSDIEFFERRYELSTGALAGRINVNEFDEYVLPISWLNYERGYNVRQPWPGAPRRGRPDKPKSRVWMHSDKPVQSAYRDSSNIGHPQTLVIVEDQLSAVKAARVIGVDCAVALMGTHLNTERVREIAALQPEEVIIALDRDATAKAFQHARTFGLAFRRTRVALLERDIKDTKLSDISAVLGL